MLKPIKKLLELNAYLISISITIAIIYLSLTSTAIVGVYVSDKILHAIAYFTLALSWYFSLVRYLPTVRKKIQIAFLVFLFGCIIEYVQGNFTTDRTLDFYDIIANTTGIAIAYISYNKLVNWFKTI